VAAKLTRLTHKTAIQLHLVAESFTICSSRPPGGQSGNFWIYLCLQWPVSVILSVYTDPVCTLSASHYHKLECSRLPVIPYLRLNSGVKLGT
jgi:hypothetical protein